MKTIAGVASRNDDSVTEFKLSYKRNVAEPWHFYKENDSEKVCGITVEICSCAINIFYLVLCKERDYLYRIILNLN